MATGLLGTPLHLLDLLPIVNNPAAPSTTGSGVAVVGVQVPVIGGALSPVVTNLLDPSATSLLNLKASLLPGDSLVVLDGNVLQKGANGSLVDVGLDIGNGMGSSGPLIAVDGKIFGQGADGSLIDLDLGIGNGGAIVGDGTPGDTGNGPGTGGGTGPGVGTGGGTGDGSGTGVGTGGGAGPGGSVGDLSDLDVFRFFNVETGVHFYTASESERDLVIRSQSSFKFEGQAFEVSSDPSDGPEVFRFFNKDTGTHFYTASESERDLVIAENDSYAFEGVAYTAFADDGGGQHQALYRFYNTDTGAHFYTASDAEAALTISNAKNYNYDGIAYYVDI